MQMVQLLKGVLCRKAAPEERIWIWSKSVSLSLSQDFSAKTWSLDRWVMEGSLNQRKYPLHRSWSDQGTEILLSARKWWVCAGVLGPRGGFWMTLGSLEGIREESLDDLTQALNPSSSSLRSFAWSPMLWCVPRTPSLEGLLPSCWPLQGSLSSRECLGHTPSKATHIQWLLFNAGV